MNPVKITRVEPDIGGIFCLFHLTDDLNPYLKGTTVDDLQSEIELCIINHDDGMTKILRKYVKKGNKK